MDRTWASSWSASTWASCSTASSVSLADGAHLVEGAGQVGVGVADDAHDRGADVLAQGVRELVDVARRQAQLGLDVGQAGTGADPELAVPGVTEELLGVASGERAEVEDRLVRAVVAGLEHQHGVGLAVAAEAGQVGEGAVRAEDVVAVVAAHLQATGGDRRAARRGTARRRRRGGPRRTEATSARAGSTWCAGAQPEATNARNSSVVGRARFSGLGCCSLTHPSCHGARVRGRGNAARRRGNTAGRGGPGAGTAPSGPTCRHRRGRI